MQNTQRNTAFNQKTPTQSENVAKYYRGLVRKFCHTTTDSREEMNLCVHINAFEEGSPGEKTVDIYGDARLKTVFLA